MTTSAYRISLVTAIAIALWLYIIWPYGHYLFFMEDITMIIVNQFSHVFSILFLYYFITKRRYQRMSLLAVLADVVVSSFAISLPFIFEHYKIIDRSTMNESEFMMRQIYATALPAFLHVVAIIVLSVQLYKNTDEGKMKTSIQFVGITMLTSLLMGGLIVPLLGAFFHEYYTIWYHFILLASAMEGLAFVIMYALELKHIRDSEVGLKT